MQWKEIIYSKFAVNSISRVSFSRYLSQDCGQKSDSHLVWIRGPENMRIHFAIDNSRQPKCRSSSGMKTRPGLGWARGRISA